MTNLTGIFKAEPEDAQDNEKLVDLFRNRAELKKEFAALRNEKVSAAGPYQAAAGRLTERAAKNGPPRKPLAGSRVGAQRRCVLSIATPGRPLHAKLAALRKSLKQHVNNALQNRFEEWKEQCDQRTAAVQAQIGQHRLKTQMLEDQLQAERHQIATMNGISKMFSSKNIQATIDGITANIEARAKYRSGAAKNASRDSSSRVLPIMRGSMISTKRSINFMILAFAQQLYLHFEDDDLARLAKEASEKSVGAVNYGTKYECDEIIEKIEKRWESMESVTDYAEFCRRRAKFLADDAIFRNDSDVIPLYASTAAVYAIDANGLVRKRDANLLGDNYFGIAKVLSR